MIHPKWNQIDFLDLKNSQKSTTVTHLKTSRKASENFSEGQIALNTTHPSKFSNSIRGLMLNFFGGYKESEYLHVRSSKFLFGK